MGGLGTINRLLLRIEQGILQRYLPTTITRFYSFFSRRSMRLQSRNLRGIDRADSTVSPVNPVHFAVWSASIPNLTLAGGVLAFLVAAVAGCGSGVVSSLPTQSINVPTASAKGPQLGYLWLNADQTLRPILGVAGASQIGASVVPAGTYVSAVSSASASVALLQGADGSFDLMTLPSGSPSSLGLTLPVGAAMRLSPSAAVALVYTPGATSASLVTGLLTTPQVQSIAAPGAIADSAVSDTGSVSFAYSQGSSTTVAVMALSGRSIPVASMHADGGLSFLAGRDDLLFADASANSLALVRSATTAPAISVIQTGSALNTPSAVGVSQSGHWALVANSSSPTVVRVDLTTQTGTSVACTCKPTEAAVLADDGTFRVTNVTTGPNWIVDASSTTARTLFIPAFPAPAKTSIVASVVGP